MESSVGVQSGGLELEHRCDIESTIVVQHKINIVILTPKEKRVLRDKKYGLRKKFFEEDVEKEQERKRKFYNKDDDTERIKRNLKQLYKNSPQHKTLKK